MFHRRLLVLGALMAGAMLLLAGQLGRLTIASGAELLAEAEKPLVSQRWIETQRGKIYDRKGRLLAADRPSFDVEAHYSVISGSWAYSEAARDARRAHGEVWSTLSDFARDGLVRTFLPDRVRELDSVWNEMARISGVDRDELEDRRTRIVERTQKLAASVWGRRRIERLKEWSESRDRSLNPPTTCGRRACRSASRSRLPHVVLRDGINDDAAFGAAPAG